MSSVNGSKPNLFLVGSMKCGTTSLHRYLEAHPQIFMTKDPWKEPAFFVDRLNWSRGEEWYCRLFQDAGDAAIRGESSTDYSKYPFYQGVAERIARFCPGARILYLMRDPIERSVSHYWWEVQWSAEGRDIATAVRKSDIIRDVSYYALQLRQFLPLFGRERVLALTTEELSATPEGALQGIFQWLEVDDSFVPCNLDERHNVSPETVRRVIGSEVFSRLHGGILWNVAKRVIPSNVRRQAIRALSRRVPRDSRGLETAIRYLRPIQREQTSELAVLLGREFPEWKTLYGDGIPE